jgi:hypothetical protein
MYNRDASQLGQVNRGLFISKQRKRVKEIFYKELRRLYPEDVVADSDPP